MRTLETHCRWGHKYTSVNTRYHGSRRLCRVCANESSKEAWAAKRERAELRETLATMGSTVDPPPPDLVKEWYAKAKTDQDQETQRRDAKRRVEKRKGGARRTANREVPS